MVPLDPLGDGDFKVSGGFSSQKHIPQYKTQEQWLGKSSLAHLALFCQCLLTLLASVSLLPVPSVT